MKPTLFLLELARDQQYGSRKSKGREPADLLGQEPHACQVDLLQLKKKHTHTHTKAVQIETPVRCQPMKASNNWLIQPPNPCRCEQLVIFSSPLPAAHLPSSGTREQAYKPALQKDHRGPLRN